MREIFKDILNTDGVGGVMLFAANGDFSAAIGNAVAAGWDTDCNGATVGGLAGLGLVAARPAWLLGADNRQRDLHPSLLWDALLTTHKPG